MATNLYKAGAFATDDPTQIITLYASNQTSARVSTFRRNTPNTAGYQVTAGKTLYIVGIKVHMPDPATGFLASISLGYADNDVGIDTTTARTNPVDVWGSPESATAPLAGGIMYNHATTAATAAAVIDRFMGSLSQTLMKAAASQKYMYMKVFQNAAGLAVTLQCVEL